jgi:hypothetical protein
MEYNLITPLVGIITAIIAIIPAIILHRTKKKARDRCHDVKLMLALIDELSLMRESERELCDLLVEYSGKSYKIHARKVARMNTGLVQSAKCSQSRLNLLREVLKTELVAIDNS